MKNNESKKKGIMTRTRGERLGMKGRKNFEKEKKKNLTFSSSASEVQWGPYCSIQLFVLLTKRYITFVSLTICYLQCSRQFVCIRLK